MEFRCGASWVLGALEGSRLVGALLVDDDGRVQVGYVRAGSRRLGVGRELLERARVLTGEELHADQASVDGTGWLRACRVHVPAAGAAVLSTVDAVRAGETLMLVLWSRMAPGAAAA